jgi:ribosomal protein L35
LSSSVFCLQTRAASNGNVCVPSASFTAFHSRDITPLKVQTKIKPKKSAVKRFKVTSNGKLLHSHSGKQHLAVKKSGELLGRQQHRPVIHFNHSSQSLHACRSSYRSSLTSSARQVTFISSCHSFVIFGIAHASHSDADATNIKRLLTLR